MKKRTKQWMMVLCACALAGCAQDRMNRDNGMASTGGSSSSGYSQNSTASTGSSGSMSSTSSYNNANNQASTTGMSSSGSMQTTGYGIIQTIEPLQRQDISAGTIGAAAVGGSGMGTDKVYRVTLHMDDGSTQQVVVESMPNYRKGDRVRYNNGALEGVQ